MLAITIPDKYLRELRRMARKWLRECERRGIEPRDSLEELGATLRNWVEGNCAESENGGEQARLVADMLLKTTAAIVLNSNLQPLREQMEAALREYSSRLLGANEDEPRTEEEGDDE